MQNMNQLRQWQLLPGLRPSHSACTNRKSKKVRNAKLQILLAEEGVLQKKVELQASRTCEKTCRSFRSVLIGEVKVSRDVHAIRSLTSYVICIVVLA